MKILTRAACAILLVLTFSAQAQTLKFGHINSADLIELMPEVKLADSALAKYQKSLEDLNSSMIKEYQTKISTFDKSSATMTPEKREIEQQAIQDLENRIQTFQGSAQDKLSDKKRELYSPILKKAEDAIKAVAKEKSYSYVFDTSVGAVIYAQDSDDIMGLVKAKLGLK